MKENESQKPKETQIGPYEIKAKIGQGGTSVVYRAVDTRNQRVVALKVLTPLFATDPKFLRRFINEGKNVKRLDHPNIVQVYDADEAEGRQYIAMELVEGGSLSELIKNRNTLLPTDEALNIIEQIASALDYAHGLGILHRDIKLSNVLLTQDGRALLTDFGSAKHMYGEHTVVTQSGFSVGTPTFMSPEQAKGDPDIDRRTDVYSLGVAAYAILVGRLPFKADSQVALLHKIIYDPPPLPEQANPEIAPGIAYALKRVLSKDPPMRYSTAGEFAAALIEGKSWVPGTQDYTNIPTFPHGTGTFFVPQQQTQKSRSLMSLLPLFLMFTLGALALIFGLLAWLNQDFRCLFISDACEIVEVLPVDDAPGEPSTKAPDPLKPVVLVEYIGEQFALNVPDDWSSSTSDTTVNFDSPELFARLFVQRLDGASPDELPEEVVDRYLESIGDNYHNREVIEDSPRTVGEISAREKILTANWLGKDVTVRLIGLQDRGQSYVLGSIVASEYDPLLSTVLNSVADSFTISDNIALLATPIVSETATGDDDSNDNNELGNGGSNGSVEVTPQTVEPTDTNNTTNTEESTSGASISETSTREASTREAENIVVSGSVTQTVTPLAAGLSTPTAAGTSTESSLADAAKTSAAQPQATNTATSTETSTATPKATNTEIPTGTSIPVDTATEIPTATASPTVSQTPTDLPTATQTPTDLPTATRTPTDLPTATSTERPTATATNSATPAPTSTIAATSTATATSTERPTQRPTATLTSTPLPTSTNTPRPTNTATIRPTSTATSTPTYTPSPTAVPPTLAPPTVAPPTAVPNSASPISGAAIQPVSPASNSDGGNRITFEWAPNFTPRQGQGFELVFWRPGQTPIANSFGLAAPTTGTSVSADLASLDNTLGELLVPGEYQWGILLVQQQPYRRVQYLGGGWQFRYVRGSSGSSSSRSPSSGE